MTTTAGGDAARARWGQRVRAGLNSTAAAFGDPLVVADGLDPTSYQRTTASAGNHGAENSYDMVSVQYVAADNGRLAVYTVRRPPERPVAKVVFDVLAAEELDGYPDPATASEHMREFDVAQAGDALLTVNNEEIAALRFRSNTGKECVIGQFQHIEVAVVGHRQHRLALWDTATAL